MMDHWRKLQIFMGTVDNLLDDFLITNLNRKAKVNIIPEKSYKLGHLKQVLLFS